jgi:hypothetical protein
MTGEIQSTGPADPSAKRYGGLAPRGWDDPAIVDALTDAIASEDRREWLDVDEAAEIVDDLIRCLREIAPGGAA